MLPPESNTWTEERRRLEEAAAKAKTVPLEEHVPFQWKDNETYKSCVKCGFIEPRKGGYSKPCVGWVKVSLR